MRSTFANECDASRLESPADFAANANHGNIRGACADEEFPHVRFRYPFGEHRGSFQRGRLGVAFRDQRFASVATCSPSRSASMMLGSKSSAIHSCTRHGGYDLDP